MMSPIKQQHHYYDHCPKPKQIDVVLQNIYYMARPKGIAMQEPTADECMKKVIVD